MTREERNEIILTQWREGIAYNTIGAAFGISKQRVRQIVDRATNRDVHLALQREKYWRDPEKQNKNKKRRIRYLKAKGGYNDA